MRILPVLFLVVAFAGCIGDDPAPVVDDPAPTPTAAPPVDLLDEETALARSLLIEEPTLLMEGPLQTFGTAIASYGDGTRLAAAAVIGGDYFVRVSDDAGRTWSEAVQATDGASATTHSAQAASIDFGGPNDIHLSWSGSPGIMWAVSRDGGATWADPVAVDGNGGNGLDGFTDLAANEAGRIATIWLRGSTEGGTGAADTIRGYFGAVSEDNGATWTVEQLPGANEPCDCCGAAVTMREDGTVFGLWRNIYEPGPDQARDYTLSVNEPGKGWSQPQRLEPSGWKFNGCPASASAINLALDGTVTAPWWTRAAQAPGYQIGTVAPGETQMVTHQVLQSDAPASASASATDGQGNAWAMWVDEATNPHTVRLARGADGVYERLGSFEGFDWPRMAATPDGFVAVMMDGDDNMVAMRVSQPLSPAIIEVDVKRGFAPLDVQVNLKAAGGIEGNWSFDDGQGNTETGNDLPASTSVRYDAPGTYAMRFSIDAEGVRHETVLPVIVERKLVVPDPASFSAGQPLVSCNGFCLSQDSPDSPAIDGFWTPIDERYWGLAAAAVGDVQNIGGDGTAMVVFYDADLNELAGGNAVITPDGAAWAFAHGNFSIWGGSAIYEDMTLHFSLPGV